MDRSSDHLLYRLVKSPRHFIVCKIHAKVKDKKKQGAQPTISLLFEGGIPFHKINDYSWATGLAIMGHAQESLEKALNAFEQLILLQSCLHPSSNVPDNHLRENILFSSDYKTLRTKAELLHLPLAAGILWSIYQLHPKAPLAKEALQKYYPKLLAYQNLLYQERDPQEDGLITNLHPWESFHGQEDHWQEKLRSLSNKQVPQNDKISVGYHLLEQLSEGTSPMEIQDPLFHSFMSWSNESLIQMGGVLGEDVQDIMEKYELTVFSINDQLWNADQQKFCPFDLKQQIYLPVDVLYSALCLFSEVATQDLAEELYPQLEKRLKMKMATKIKAQEFHPLSIAGQILLLEGLNTYGFDELSVLLMQRLNFLLQQNAKQQEHDFLMKGFKLFLQS